MSSDMRPPNLRTASPTGDLLEISPSIPVRVSVGGCYLDQGDDGMQGEYCSGARRSLPSPQALPRSNRPVDENRCLLLFSGGRDSTLAAIRLVNRFSKITLLTVTSDHLTGINAVFTRLQELASHLPEDCRHLQVLQPTYQLKDELVADTCLPCHRAYLACGLLVALRLGIAHLACGYAGYQRGWPEQSMYATSSVRGLLANLGFTLHLPAYDLESKAAAIDELNRYGLTPHALEQKCTKQINNVELPEHTLVEQIDRWMESTAGMFESMSADDLAIVSNATIATLEAASSD